MQISSDRYGETEPTNAPGRLAGTAMVTRVSSLPVATDHRGSAIAASAGGFSGRWAFVLAAAGSAVGLGNIWKFPYIAGENGGGAFVLVYLVAILAIGVPALIAEIAVGRLTATRPVIALHLLARAGGHSARWRWLGWLGIATAFAILSFYSVVAGWSLQYLWMAVNGDLLADIGTDAAAVFGARFDALLSDPWQLALGHTVIMVITVAIVSRGIRRGVERATQVLMPGLLLLLAGLVAYAAASTGEFGRAAAFLLAPDFSRLSWGAVGTAVGHACFTLSVGMTVMMAYGQHLHGRRATVGGTACAIAGLDTLVALLAGLAIFPLVFANELAPGAGPGLIFVTLPIAFSQLPAGSAVAAAFFLLLSVAAISSTISVLEPVVEQAEERRGWTRPGAALAAGAAIWLLGLASVLSFNAWADVELFGMTPFGLLDRLTSDVLLPCGVLLTALFVGWRVPAALTAEVFGGRTGHALWRLAVRFVTPLGVVAAVAWGLLH